MFQDKMNFSHTLTRNNIVKEARYWLGTPFKHQGRNHNGIDCVGLIIKVAEEFGITNDEIKKADYPRRSPHSRAFMSYFDKYLIKKNNRFMREGDIVILKEPIFPCHCGIIGKRSNEFTLIHSYAPQKKVVEEFFYPSNWDKLHVGTYEFPGLEEF